MKIKLTQRKKQLRPDTNRHLRFYMQYPDNAFRDLMATSAAGGATINYRIGIMWRRGAGQIGEA
ncbi:MAG TPA: hypothetical protein VLJ17_16870 [Xanthobacteraceae bacterium]|nr:hypothetical protein [Xanthobacteraceae bacterium]